MSDAKRIADIQARHAASTPGEWAYEDRPGRRQEDCGCVVYVGEDSLGHELFDTFNRGYKESLVTPEMDEGSCHWYDTRGAFDLEFAAHAHQDVPYLLGAISAADQRIAELESGKEALQKTVMATSEACAKAMNKYLDMEEERDEWRTKAMDVEEHPVVKLLVSERDNLRTQNDIFAKNVEWFRTAMKCATKALEEIESRSKFAHPPVIGNYADAAEYYTDSANFECAQIAAAALSAQATT